MKGTKTSHRKFLVVDDDLFGRFHVSGTLLRRYPTAVVQECQDLYTASEVVSDLPVSEHATVVIARRTPQAGGRRLIAALRAGHSSVPIVWLGDPREETLAPSAGATRFMSKDAWLLIGEVVADLT